MVERPIKLVRCINNNLRYTVTQGTPQQYDDTLFILYQFTKKNQHQIKRMTGYIKESHTTLFTGPTGCGKTHLVLDLIEKKYNKHFDNNIIICPTPRWNKTYYSNDQIENDGKVWLIEPKDKLYQWIEKLSQFLARSETLFIIDEIIADEGFDKRRHSLLELAISVRHSDHYLDFILSNQKV